MRKLSPVEAVSGLQLGRATGDLAEGCPFVKGVRGMTRRGEQETPSLKWIHRVREQHYKRTKGLPIEAWLRPADLIKVAHAFRRLGLRVKSPAKK